ncbi:prepilin-type N-terminal cleavage/methylation domain-containing protein [Deinococcus metalli]|uniref:Prepilin-type N-terminal cleavage/methylation domain-containing protein n=1 Tax=Deinococcus metalli TaxID=1141878 RepID=A0A7W8KFA7_9DEIO|nr:prepilin-type N-terminal cleavage/methylation domain-containing protein [Deinococcus metalli]MBB5377142.1 prepilin-type N-terminal cleavage/methylation domain-containing protein [Deinococcus metalli]GHF48689.1 hypothetical protein GCM10017781_26340 [Deinococcus metalli]
MKTAQGMTLIEVLIGIAIFAVVVVISSAVTASLSTNKVSADRLAANQAAQAFFESVTEYWRTSTAFGNADPAASPTPFPVPAEINGYNWSLTISDIDMTSATFAPKTSVTWTKSSKTAYTASASATLMDLSLTYTPTASGSSFVNGTEIYKR